MCCATIPETAFGSIKSTDPVLFLWEQQRNAECILLVTTALTRGKMYLIFQAYNSKIFFSCQSCQFFPLEREMSLEEIILAVETQTSMSKG